MNNLIDAALHRSRTILMLFTLIMIVGIITTITIPKESNPDIQVPIVYVSVGHEGISPEDADRLIYKPLETELKSLDGFFTPLPITCKKRLKPSPVYSGQKLSASVKSWQKLL